MIPLHRDPGFTFRFNEARRIDRIHLDGVPAGTPVTVTDLAGRVRLRQAVAGDGGWVRLDPPLVVAPGGGFVATV